MFIFKQLSLPSWLSQFCSTLKKNQNKILRNISRLRQIAFLMTCQQHYFSTRNSLFLTILIPYFLTQFTRWYKGETMVAENTLTEFAGDTSIHGLVFMVKSTASVKRRILWTLLFIGSVTYAGIQIKSIIECKCNKIKQYQGKSVKDVRFFLRFLEIPTST